MVHGQLLEAHGEGLEGWWSRWGAGCIGNGRQPSRPRQQKHERHYQRCCQPAKAALLDCAEQLPTHRGAERLANARSGCQSAHGNAKFVGRCANGEVGDDRQHQTDAGRGQTDADVHPCVGTMQR